METIRVGFSSNIVCSDYRCLPIDNICKKTTFFFGVTESLTKKNLQFYPENIQNTRFPSKFSNFMSPLSCLISCFHVKAAEFSFLTESVIYSTLCIIYSTLELTLIIHFDMHALLKQHKLLIMWIYKVYHGAHIKWKVKLWTNLFLILTTSSNDTLF